MKSKLAITLASAILLIAALFLALPPQHVSAQTCRDARGNVIPCPEKKKPTETSVPSTATSVPTSTPAATPTKPPSTFGFGGISPIPTDKRPPKIHTPWGDLPTFGGVLKSWPLLGGLLLLLLIVGLIINRGTPDPGQVLPHVDQALENSSFHIESVQGFDLVGSDTVPQAQLGEGSKLQPPAEPRGGVHEHVEELGSSKPLLPADEQLDLGGSDTGPQPQSGEDPSPPPDPEPGDRGT